MRLPHFPQKKKKKKSIENENGIWMFLSSLTSYAHQIYSSMFLIIPHTKTKFERKDCDSASFGCLSKTVMLKRQNVHEGCVVKDKSYQEHCSGLKTFRIRLLEH
jgi:hypothetical protein